MSLRRTPLKSGKPPARKTQIKRVNRKRKAKRFEENFGGALYVRHIRRMSCAVCGASYFWTNAAHLTSRGAGGKAADIVPLCIGCHRRYDDHHAALRRHEPRLRELAKALWSAWQQLQEIQGADAALQRDNGADA